MNIIYRWGKKETFSFYLGRALERSLRVRGPTPVYVLRFCVINRAWMCQRKWRFSRHSPFIASMDAFKAHERPIDRPLPAYNFTRFFLPISRVLAQKSPFFPTPITLLHGYLKQELFFRHCAQCIYVKVELS